MNVPEGNPPSIFSFIPNLDLVKKILKPTKDEDYKEKKVRKIGFEF